MTTSEWPNPASFSITRLTWAADDVALLTMDDPSSSANVMNAALQTELEARLDQLETAKSCRGLLVATAKPRIFIAGADIKYIAATADFSRQQVIRFCERGLRIYHRFSQLPFPSVALIHGACLGGGFEFALALDWRIASDDPATVLGLPEVHLGLIPGWGATARVPRLASVETGMRRIGGGENFSPQVGLQMGLVDQVTATDQLQAAAIQHLQSAAEGWYRQRRRAVQGPATCLTEDDHLADRSEQPAGESDGDPAPCLTETEVLELAGRIQQELAAEHSHRHCRVPKMVVDLIARSALTDFAEACQLESETMAEVYTSPAAQALVHAFLLNDRAKKSPGLGPPPTPLPEIRRVGIVGMGLMGTSLAQLLQSGPWQLVLYDNDPAVAERLSSQFNAPNIQIAAAWEDLADCDVVLENVVEQLEVKRKVLRELEAVVGPNSFLLTNTSVIPIGKLAAGLRDPQRFGGLHFFNPIRQTQLAEIATHDHQSKETPWVAHWVAKQMGKRSLVVGDGPGLVVNRLLMAMLDQAQHLLSEGLTVLQVDQAARDFGWRLGPFQILDVIGLKTALDAGSQIAADLPQAIDAPPFLLPLIKAGRRGQAAGLGFYRYDDQGQAHPDPAVESLLQAYRRQPVPESALAAGVGVTEAAAVPMAAERMLAAMIGQAAAILERGQVKQAADIDLACLLGLGFPPHHGGLLYWADHYPLGQLVETLANVATAAAAEPSRRTGTAAPAIAPPNVSSITRKECLRLAEPLALRLQSHPRFYAAAGQKRSLVGGGAS